MEGSHRFLRWRTAPTFTGFLDFVHYPVTEVSRLALSKGHNKVGVSLPSPEGGNRSSFRNVVFSNYLEFRTMDKVQKPSDSEFCLYCMSETCVGINVASNAITSTGF
jgi:hypothetical protein